MLNPTVTLLHVQLLGIPLAVVVGAVVSTVITVLHVVTAEFQAASFTVFSGKMNFHHQFTLFFDV